MLKLKIFRIVYIILVFLCILLCTKCYFVSGDPVSSNSSAIENDKNIIEVPYSSIVLIDKISFLEQNRLVRKKLIQEGYQNITKNNELTRNFANHVIDYILRYQNNEEKITELATLLMRPLGKYGSENGEEILYEQKISVIHEWLKRLILGRSFIDWIMDQIHDMRNKGNILFINHGIFENLFLEQLHAKTKHGKLSLAAKKYYTDNMLIEDMPSFLLKVDEDEFKNLQQINLSKPEFGYLHVGLTVLREGKLDPYRTWSLEEIMDVGILIESSIREGNITNLELFELPAKIYYASTLYNNTPVAKILGSFYEEYFEMIDRSRQSNPFFQVMDRLRQWKTRSQLASEVLKANNISEDFLSSYMTHGDSSERSYPNSKGELIRLPSIDNIFDEQNKNVSSNFQELNKYMLLQTMEKINKENLQFIQSAEVKIVQVILKNDQLKFGIAFTDDDHNYNSIIKVLSTDSIDLLQCITGNEERIYALDTDNYELHRVDRDRKKIFSLFKDDDPGSSFNLLEFPTISLIKNRKESVEVMIEKLSKIHRNKLYNTLKNKGYDATFWQKFSDFTLNLLPFYTCITELKNGNLNDAAIPCTFDSLMLIPFVGQSLKLAYKFGTATLRASLVSIRLAAREATIFEVIRLAGKDFVTNGITHASKTLDKKVLFNLGYEFLRGVDPGIGLLKLGGAKFLQVFKRASEYLKKGLPKLDKLAQKLAKQAEIVLSTKNLIPANVLNTKETVILPFMKEGVAVVKVGEKYGKDVLVRISENDNILFGRKYVRDAKTGEIDLAPISLGKRIFLLKTIGLNGDAQLVAQKWAEAERQGISLKSIKRVNEVFRVDTRGPEVIVPHGVEGAGCRPRIGIYNHNLEAQHTLFGIDDLSNSGWDEVSPFVSTFSNLHSARQYGKSWTVIEDLKFALQNGGDIDDIEPIAEDIIAYIYRIRPNKDFYNLRESYIAARDVSRPGSTRYNEINEIVEKWGNDGEYSALHGFDNRRIIEYAPLTRSDDSLSELLWTPNTMYNHDFDNDLTAEDLYTHVAIYKDGDFMDIASNIVQQTLQVNRKVASTALLTQLQSEKIKEIVTKYNRNKNKQLETISSLKVTNGGLVFRD